MSQWKVIMEFNLKAEVRDGYAVSAEMKKIWQTELDLLQRFIDFCKANTLQCWLDGGTLLGAVRHHGFIPWDDDVDVVMPRADYDRMLQLAPQWFEPPYFLQSAYTDKDYYRGHAQLRNSATAAIRPSDSFQPFNQGIFIDIFVLDAVPVNEVSRKRLVHDVRKMLRFLKAKNTAILASGRLGLVFRKLKCRYMVHKYGWVTLYRRVEDELRATPWNDCRQVAELAFSGDEILFDKHIFDRTVWIDFEYIKAPVVEDFDTFLRTQYGDDYMTPVKAPSYHGELVFSTTQSYRELLPAVRRSYRMSVFRRLLKKLGQGFSPTCIPFCNN